LDAVQTASNGAEALRLLRSGARPRLVVLDLMMPVMNGWEFRAEQMGDPSLAQIPVVIMTGFGGAAEKATKLGAAGSLRKPIDVDTLFAMVRRFL
jgi:two-component system response regulator MprA